MVSSSGRTRRTAACTSGDARHSDRDGVGRGVEELEACLACVAGAPQLNSQRQGDLR
jgi:hypothetical protein